MARSGRGSRPRLETAVKTAVKTGKLTEEPSKRKIGELRKTLAPGSKDAGGARPMYATG